MFWLFSEGRQINRQVFQSLKNILNFNISATECTQYNNNTAIRLSNVHYKFARYVISLPQFFCVWHKVTIMSLEFYSG
jgi:hypothetical protein